MQELPTCMLNSPGPCVLKRVPVLILFVWLSAGSWQANAAWTALSHTNTEGVGTMLLLSDGTVMAQGSGTTANWFRLTPDIHGSYINGTWSQLASMRYTRLYGATAVLQDGRVFFAGAEYGTGTTNAEVYDPVGNSWTSIPVPAGLIQTNNTIGSQGQNQAGFSDSGCIVLSDGKVMIAPVYPANISGIVIFDPVSNTFSSGASLINLQDEASWVKLPDDSILTVDQCSTTAERYIPSLNQWVADSSCPVSLYGAGCEEGAAFLLPNGKVLFLGGTTNTAIYTPSGNNSPGSWVAGPSIPNGQAAPDAAGAMMVNGRILCAVSPQATGSPFTTPTSFYEYDYSVGAIGAFTQTTAPGSGFPPPFTLNVATFVTRMLALPNGNILFTFGSPQLYVYQPTTGPIAAGKPTVNSVSWNADGSLHLIGTLFNGISQGAAYGDDAQMDSNYPIVRFVDSGGNVTYGRTFHWSSTSMMTGSRLMSTECSVPWALFAGQGPYSLYVVANGIASNPFAFYGPVWVDFNFGGFIHAGTYALPYNTMASATNAVLAGGTIVIKGTGSSSELLSISKPMNIHSVYGPNTIGH